MNLEGYGLCDTRVSSQPSSPSEMSRSSLTTESFALQGGDVPLKTPVSLVLGGDEGCV